MFEIDEYQVLENGLVDDEAKKKIEELLKAGGLCILPSDSAYTLTGLITCPGVTDDIDTILNRNGLAMSLAFHSMEQVTDRIIVSECARKVLERLMPGALTFVLKTQNPELLKASKKLLNVTDGITIGVRLSESPVETQLAEYFPLPTTPIRKEGNLIVKSKAAFAEIKEQLSGLSAYNRKIAWIKGKVPFPKRLSTVIVELENNGKYYLIIRRSGAIDRESVEKIAQESGYEDVFVELESEDKRYIIVNPTCTICMEVLEEIAAKYNYKGVLKEVKKEEKCYLAIKSSYAIDIEAVKKNALESGYAGVLDRDIE